MSMSGTLMLLSKKKDTDGTNLDIYQMKPEEIIGLANHVRCCNMSYESDNHKEKTIMLLGETGSGKSTLIDALFNYIAGVSLVDDYRFKLVNLTKEEKVKEGKQNESQTNGITCYRIPWKHGSKIDCKLCVIDTPGFNDTRGPEFDKQISEMVKNLFQKGIKGLDALCLVVNVTRVRITDREMYVFSSILELFAKDISDNIFLFLTHDDGATGEPTILQSLRKSDIPIKNGMHFRFNNANLFSILHSSEVWKAKDNNFSRFFDKT
ncbi:unnamed protein product [Mytilus edulis]|uniref:AIG1-type G domain-containing protein n=1 Tax=Mytilus edulis TaxID=6550 RepID=A0A8S3SX19_MYTED|nr:unnamed protein product [Mytilus edulis]